MTPLKPYKLGEHHETPFVQERKTLALITQLKQELEVSPYPENLKTACLLDLYNLQTKILAFGAVLLGQFDPPESKQPDPKWLTGVNTCRNCSKPIEAGLLYCSHVGEGNCCDEHRATLRTVKAPPSDGQGYRSDGIRVKKSRLKEYGSIPNQTPPAPSSPVDHTPHDTGSLDTGCDNGCSSPSSSSGGCGD